MKTHYERFVHALVRGLGPVLCPEYTVNIRFDVKEVAQEEHVGTTDTPAIARVSVDTTYMHAAIELSPEVRALFRSREYQEIFETVLHELCHTFAEGLYEQAIALAEDGLVPDGVEVERERTAQKITTAVMRLLPAGFVENIVAATRARRKRSPAPTQPEPGQLCLLPEACGPDCVCEKPQEARKLLKRRQK